MTELHGEHLLTATEAAESLRITGRAFRLWQVEPVRIDGRHRYFDGRAILNNRMAALKRKRARPAGSAGELKTRIDQLETELTTARAEGQAMRNAELRGELVRIGNITQAIATACAGASAALETIPGKVKRLCPALSSQEINDVRAAVVRCQNEAAAVTLNWSQAPEVPADEA